MCIWNYYKGRCCVIVMLDDDIIRSNIWQNWTKDDTVLNQNSTLVDADHCSVGWRHYQIKHDEMMRWKMPALNQNITMVDDGIIRLNTTWRYHEMKDASFKSKHYNGRCWIITMAGAWVEDIYRLLEFVCCVIVQMMSCLCYSLAIYRSFIGIRMLCDSANDELSLLQSCHI
jgi:hypothetical protein